MHLEKFSVPDFLSGGGEAGEIIRNKDWSATPLGNPEDWPQSLKTCVRIILTSSQPMFVWWGKDLINIYNDAYKAILGGKHPLAFGKPASEVWKEIWNEAGPRAETVMTQNTGTYDEALLLIMERNGYPEETYYTFSYSPIPGDKGGVGGIICANTNNTELVINERSIQTLRDLATISYNEKTLESVYTSAAEILHRNNKDFPCAIFYKIDEDQKGATAVAWAGDPSGYQDFPLTVNLEIPEDNARNLFETVRTNEMRLVKNNGRRVNIPKGFWDVVPSEFLHVPINYPNKNKPIAILTIGLNPYRQFNDAYRNSVKLIADQISLIVNNVLAYEEERKRAEALEAGADDYLVKPFSAKEVQARVKAQVKISQARNHINQQLQNLFVQAPIAICVLRGNDMIVDVANEHMIKLWGKENITLRTPIKEVLPEIEEQGFIDLLRQVFISGERYISNESPVKLIRSGREENIFVKFVFEALRDEDGTISGVMIVADEITQQVHAQEELEKTVAERTKSLRRKNEELKASEERYHRMTDEVQDYSIILLDRDGNIMQWNNGARKIKGYTEEEIIGKNFRIFYLPEDLESYLPEKLIAQAVDTGRAVNEGWRMRKNGTTFWASVVITALHNNKGHVVGFSKVTRDLTERKLAEDITKKYLVELEKQNAELEQFAYVSSHDLQEPLRKIRTFSDLLGTMVEDESQKNYLNKINSSAERMTALIKDLLDYSRLTKENETFVPVDLNHILENIKTDLEVAISQKHAVITSNNLPQVKGISLQFNQLFMNLLSNSLKFNTGQPLIRITAEQAPLYETIAAKLDPKWSYVKISFSDNGIGFEPQYSDQIFTIFQRLNTKQKFSGTGIGLAMCKKIIDNHNGHIQAHGKPGEGATFVIYLPER